MPALRRASLLLNKEIALRVMDGNKIGTPCPA